MNEVIGPGPKEVVLTADEIRIALVAAAQRKIQNARAVFGDITIERMTQAPLDGYMRARLEVK